MMAISKLIDFGLSSKMDGSGQAKALMKCGTLGYMAPELDKSMIITPAIDMWAFGIVLYELATAYKPTAVRKYTYGSGPIPFAKRDWRNRSKHLQDLIVNCLKMDPSERLSASDALSHPWFTEPDE